mgnify:CR=1 FL=1
MLHVVAFRSVFLALKNWPFISNWSHESFSRSVMVFGGFKIFRVSVVWSIHIVHIESIGLVHQHSLLLTGMAVIARPDSLDFSLLLVELSLLLHLN